MLINMIIYTGNDTHIYTLYIYRKPRNRNLRGLIFFQLSFALYSLQSFYLHTVRVLCWKHERPIQIEYLRETKHASRYFIARAFVS